MKPFLWQMEIDIPPLHYDCYYCEHYKPVTLLGIYCAY